jgi:glycerol-3-phosphate dehydrogenase subunit B
MIAGDLHDDSPMLIVGFEGFNDFYPQLAADNLSAQGIRATGILLKLPPLDQHKMINSLFLARQFDQPGFCMAVVKAIKAQYKPSNDGYARIGFPAVLGTEAPLRNKEILEKQLGVPVFEIPTLPPSIPGIRLSRMLVRTIQEQNGRVLNGMQVLSAQSPQDNSRQIEAIWSEAAARRRPHRAKTYILSTGGLLGGGLRADYTGAGTGIVREMILDIPIYTPLQRSQWLQREFISAMPHPINDVGVRVNAAFQPVDLSGQVLFENLLVAGITLAGGDYLRERSLEGVDLASGYYIGERIQPCLEWTPDR